jgi:hypothetical protein
LVSPIDNPAAATDLISFLKALPDCRLRGGFATRSGGCSWWRSRPSTASRKADAYSNQGSLLGMERFAKRHRKTLNELLGNHVANSPSDST